jgi:hypothetical protein
MSIIQKQYFTLQSIIQPTYDPTTPNPATNLQDPICSEHLPVWFKNADKKFRKIVRVLGASVATLPTLIVEPQEEEDIIKPGFRLYSNINPRSNILMKTSLTDEDCKNNKFQESQNVGFIMMINNYNSAKEFDVTDDYLNDVQFYIRYWSSTIHLNFILDCVIELELLLVDDN